MDKSQLAGREGEAEAARYMRGKGYKIVAMNYRTRFGEVDVIAEKGDVVAFVEVKLRCDDRFAQAREFVTAAKTMRVRRAALSWLQREERELQPRFDVIEIYTSTGKLNHLENAF